jgi:oxygen-independent coproporphyrinogen-3 oxidase
MQRHAAKSRQVRRLNFTAFYEVLLEVKGLNFDAGNSGLRAYYGALERGELPVERGLVVRDPAVLERRSLIRAVMCDFQVELNLERFAPEWRALQELALDGLVELSEAGGRGLARVTLPGRWLIRTIAAVFDPEQARRASGSRLV